MSKVKTESEISALRESGAMLTAVLDLMVENALPGVTGKQLASMAAKKIKSLGGEPAFLGVKGMRGYQDFPSVICISIAEEVQHGIPSDRVLADGDAVNFDFGVKYKGMITDAGRTVIVGEGSKETKRLVNGTKEALMAALKEVKAGALVSNISGAIEDVLERHNLGIVLELVGHGVGHELHEEPEIPNYRVRGKEYRLSAGETIAVEPIATLGSGGIYIDTDGWTILSSDGTQAAQHEHTLLVTESGYEILAS